MRAIRLQELGQVQASQHRKFFAHAAYSITGRFANMGTLEHHANAQCLCGIGTLTSQHLFDRVIIAGTKEIPEFAECLLGVHGHHVLTPFLKRG